MFKKLGAVLAFLVINTIIMFLISVMAFDIAFGIWIGVKFFGVLNAIF